MLNFIPLPRQWGICCHTIVTTFQCHIKCYTLSLQGTALVMGWYMGQPMYQRRILPSDITFTEIVSAQPPCPCNVNNVIDVKGENATSKTQPYGPLTAQEVILTHLCRKCLYFN